MHAAVFAAPASTQPAPADAEVIATPEARAGAPQLVMQLGNSGRIATSAFSPDGRLVVTADETAILYELASRREIRRFAGHEDAIVSAAISADGLRLVTAGWDNTARLWNTPDGEQLDLFEHPSRVRWVAFTDRDRAILTLSENVVRHLDIESGAELNRLELPEAPESIAFSPDFTRLVTGNGSRWVRVYGLWDGELLGEINHDPKVEHVAYAPDGRTFATVTPVYDDSFMGRHLPGYARVFDARTFEELQSFELTSSYTSWVGYYPDSSKLMAGGASETLVIDLATGAEIAEISNWGDIWPKTVSPDGRLILGSGRLWDAATGEDLGSLTAFGERGGVSRPSRVIFSPDGEHFLISGSLDGTSPRVWEIAGGREVARMEAVAIESVAFSRDGRWLATGGWDYMVRLWEVESGRELRTLKGHKGLVGAVAFSDDGAWLLTGGDDGQALTRPKHSTARIWDTKTGRELRRYRVDRAYITAVALAPGRELFATGGDDGIVRLWQPSKQKPLAELTGHSRPIRTLDFSDDGHLLLSAGDDGTARLWDVEQRSEILRLSANEGGEQSFVANSAGEAVQAGGFGSAMFAPGDATILTAGVDTTVRLWDTATGREVLRLLGHRSLVSSAFMSPDERWIGSASEDGTVRIWDRATGRELCRVVYFSDGTWVVADPEGRFDTNSPDGLFGIHWLLEDEPLNPLPLEIFMRDYYEPRLLPRVLAGEQFPELRDLAQLNRVQPIVAITGVALEAGDAGQETADRVTVTVEVSGAEREYGTDGARRTQRTGVYDLRLFRDGQLVGYAPDSHATVEREPATSAEDAKTDIVRWRRTSEIALDPGTGKRTLTFKGIRIPRREGIEALEFSAYAFNADRVKSDTSRMRCLLAPGVAGTIADAAGCVLPKPAPRKGRAYVIAVGVNAYETGDWDLRYAAKDAEKLLSVLPPLLERTGGYAAVVQLPLISDWDASGVGGARTVTAAQATKAMFKSVLDVLAGRAVDEEVLAEIPNGELLRPALPEDLVLIAYSSHGYADQSGNFYLFPYDIGRHAGRQVTAELLPRTISSDELSMWLRDIDAADLVMIIDACHSAASVEGTGFKPGPMGASGLGQLAYDKGMRILASTRADDVALESSQTQQGLLSYVLVQDGLVNRHADFEPRDRNVYVPEWLQYALGQVPALYAQIHRDEASAAAMPGIQLAGFQRGVGVYYYTDATVATKTQQPSLFDFRRNTENDTVIARFD